MPQKSECRVIARPPELLARAPVPVHAARMHAYFASPRGWLTVAVPALLLGFYVLRAWRRARAVPRGTWVYTEIVGDVPALPPRRPWFRRWLEPRRASASLLELDAVVTRLEGDARVSGLIVALSDLRAGWATAADLRAIFARVRKAGRRVVVHLPSGAGPPELFVATAADRVLLAPQAGVGPIGVSSRAMFYRSALDRVGIEAQVVARGEFKSAADSFTRDELSPANRLQTEAMLDGLQTSLVQSLRDGRALSADEAERCVRQGWFTGREARDARLVDALAHDDELATHVKSTTPRLDLGDYVSVAKPWALPWRPRRRGRRVGIVKVHGPIVDTAEWSLGPVADAPRIVAALRRAGEHPRIAAVVLHVDSPGGSVIASDRIAREVERLSERKPVIACFGNVAASGGYYVSALARTIVARPESITGSIGVIALRMQISRLVARLGIAHEVLRRGPRADLWSPLRAWTDEDRALMERHIESTYGDFVALVARGRGKSVDAIEPLARGRVYLGREAHARGLVDQLGGLRDALGLAAAAGGVSRESRAVVIEPPRDMPDPPEAPAAVTAALRAVGVPIAWVDALVGTPANEHIVALV